MSDWRSKKRGHRMMTFFYLLHAGGDLYLSIAAGAKYTILSILSSEIVFFTWNRRAQYFPEKSYRKNTLNEERAPKSNTVVVAKYFDVSCKLQFGMRDTCFQVISVASDILLDFWNPYILLKNKKDTMTQRLKCPKEEEILTKVT